jgi:hypothetical protein
LKVLGYHSKLNCDAKAEAVRAWEETNSRKLTVMVATDGFCTGTDSPDVRTVIIAGGSRSVVEFWQAAGRAGRDGKVAYVNVLYHYDHVVRAMGGDRTGNLENEDEGTEEEEYVVEGCGDFVSLAENQSECLRRRIEKCLDGLKSFPTCIERSTAPNIVEKCFICRTVPEKDIAGSFAPVTVGGGRRISIEEVIEAKKRRKSNQVKMGSQLEKMRRWGHILSGYCIPCVYGIAMTRVFDDNPKSTARMNLRAIKECRRNICFRMRSACLRCMKRGHQARKCDVIASAQESERNICRRCFVDHIGGSPIHRPSEFGREGACPFEPLVKLCLLCYHGGGKGRNLVMDAMSEEDKEEVQDAKRFRRWLLEDKINKHAGLFEAMSRVYVGLKLKYFNLNFTTQDIM